MYERIWYAYEWIRDVVFSEYFLDIFLNGFCVSFIRPAIIIFLILILCTRFGSGIGLPLLFWRPRSWKPNTFTLTQKTVDDARNTRELGFPEYAIEKLRPLIGRTFCSQDEFIQALSDALSPNLERYSTAVRNEIATARVIKITDALLDVLHAAKVPNAALEQLVPFRNQELTWRDFERMIRDVLGDAFLEYRARIEEHVSKVEVFKITDQFLTALKDVGLPDAILSNLKLFTNWEFKSAVSFLREITGVISQDGTKQCQDFILKKTQKLYTQPNRTAQFFIGLGLGALIWQVLLAGYLFEEFATLYTKDRPPFCEVYPPYESAPVKDFGEFVGRFRYDPLAWSSMWRYGWSIFCGFVVLGVGVGLIVVLSRLMIDLHRRIIGWRPFEPASTPQDAGIDPTRIPRSWPAMLGGMFCGALLLSLVTSGLCSCGFTNDVGKWLVRTAGWGESDARKEAVKKIIDEYKKKYVNQNSAQQLDPPLDVKNRIAKEANEARQKELDNSSYREWLAPYNPVYATFFINSLIILVVSVVLMLLPRSLAVFTPAIGIILLFNMYLASNIYLYYFFPFLAEFWYYASIVMILIAGRGYKMKFPNLKGYYDRPVPLNELYSSRAVEDADDILPKPIPDAQHQPPPIPLPKRIVQLDSNAIVYPNALIAGKDKNGKTVKPPLAIVCVSGGGSRAAAWTMKVLLELERAFAKPSQFQWGRISRPNVPDDVLLPYHVRLMTGASGGMIAAAQYVASLASPDGAKQVNRRVTTDQLFDGMCEDYLTPIVHTLVSRDLPSLYIPAHLGRTDRGFQMEKEFGITLQDQLDQKFVDLRQGESDGWRPSLVFSPMLVEDGRQLFISNLDLSSLVKNSAVILGEMLRTKTGCVAGDLNPVDPNTGRRLLSREGLEFFKVFPQANDFRIATAARMSASFPYVLPACYLPTNPPRRVVDAGYYDNYGVGIAASWMFNHLDWIKKHTSGVVIIQIRDGASGESRRRECVSDGYPTVMGAGMHWLTSPPTGLWFFRQAAHTFRNDNLLHLLNGFLQRYQTNGKPAFDPEFFTTVTFELQQGDNVALSFTLTEGERNLIQNSVTEDGFKHQVAALLEWWHSR
jgi:hypothetical protein